MAITEWYVDPGSGTDDLNPGRGESFGDPWASVDYALDTGIPNTGRDAVNGDRINLIAGTADTSATWNVAGYAATASADAPLVIEGCTAAAGDGGVASVNGGGNQIINAVLFDYCYLQHLSFTNWGASWAVALDNYCQIIGCVFDGESARTRAVTFDIDCRVAGCEFVNIVTMLILDINSGAVLDSLFTGTAADMVVGTSVQICRCLFVANATGVTCINLSGARVTVEFCTCYNSTAGTEAAIEVGNDQFWVANNYIEGWSGVGGSGIETAAGAKNGLLYNNYFYNNTANVTDGGYILHQEGSTTVASSALTDPGSNDFSVNTDLQANAWPGEYAAISQTQYLDVGAVQREESGGSYIAAGAGRLGVQES